jgi:hypothetical protein
MMTLPDQQPKPRYRPSDVPYGFIPIYVIDRMGRRIELGHVTWNLTMIGGH